MIATHRNIVGRNIVGRSMFRAFRQPLAMCYDMLGLVGSNLTIFKLEPATPNMSLHVAIGWPNARNMLNATMMRPTMLRYVVLIVCVRFGRDLRSSQKYCIFRFR